MKLYISIGGGKIINEFVLANNLGWCLSPSSPMDPKGQSYIIDNGAFRSAKNSEPFNLTAFKVLVSKYRNPDFVILPDIPQIVPTFDQKVKRKLALQSLGRSLKYLDELPHPYYLPVQDGITQKDIIEYIDQVDGIFVGGTLNIKEQWGWKVKTALDWANLAHLYKKKCHVGRINQCETLLYMDYCGVDSIDGSTASRHDDVTELRKYFEHLKYQTKLDSGIKIADDGGKRK